MVIDDFGQEGLGLRAASDIKVMSLSFLVTQSKYVLTHVAWNIILINTEPGKVYYIEITRRYFEKQSLVVHVVWPSSNK